MQCFISQISQYCFPSKVLGLIVCLFVRILVRLLTNKFIYLWFVIQNVRTVYSSLSRFHTTRTFPWADAALNGVYCAWHVTAKFWREIGKHTWEFQTASGSLTTTTQGLHINGSLCRQKRLNVTTYTTFGGIMDSLQMFCILGSLTCIVVSCNFCRQNEL